MPVQIRDRSVATRATDHRARELYTSELIGSRCVTDRLFMAVMILQWIVGITVACLISPYSWQGWERHIHIHVWMAIFYGGALSVPPILLTLLIPGRVVTSLVVTVSQMLWCGFLVQLTGGRIETHFYVFVSLAFIAFYRDYRVIVLGTAVTVMDHTIRGVVWPYTIYGVLSASPWRTLEHAAWVIVEDIGLTISMYQGLRKMRELAEKQALIEDSHSRVEHDMLERTAELCQKAESLAAAENSLREKEERLALATRGTSDGLWDVNLANDDMWVSERYLELLGYAPEEICFTPNEFYSRLHGEDRDRVCAEYSNRLIDNQPINIEYRLRTKDGSYRWFRSSGKSILNEQGEALRISGAIQDISEQKKIQENQQRQEDMMHQRQKLEAVGALAGGIAHEFNNLLQIIQGFTRFARSEMPDDDERSQDLDQALQASEHAAVLTRQLLNFSRLDQVSFSQLEVGRAVFNGMKSLRPLIREDIELKVEVAEDLPTICADPNGIQQILMNLCLNAQDAMPSGGQLTVTVERWNFPNNESNVQENFKSGDYVQIRVCDTGNGMTQEVLERVFEPFFTTKDVGKGTGLGLAVVHGIIRRHEGLIRVHSEVNVGSTFRVYLPIKSEGSDEASKQTTQTPGGRETILLAEDDPMVRQFSQRVLEDAGYTLLSATNGEEAVQLFRENQNKISLLVFDVIMPKMTGRAAYEEILKMDPNVQVVFCSGHDPELVQMMTSPTMSKGRLVEKPYNPNRLLTAVRETLDKFNRNAPSLEAVS